MKNVQSPAAESARVPAGELYGAGISRFRHGLPDDHSGVNIGLQRAERGPNLGGLRLLSKHARFERVDQFQFPERGEQ